MNARAEAFERLGGRYEARVLEPSPPAIAEGPWFADDPTARGAVPEGRQVVSPMPTGDLLWDDLARGDEDLAAWCADRWLGAYRRLAPAPATLAATRAALHRVAERVLSPARERVTGKIGLRYTRGGFGTPFFGDDVQVRVAGADLVVQRGEGERSAALSTVAEAGALLGDDLLPAAAALGAEPLEIDPTAARFLGDWYGFGTSVLEELRALAGDELEPSRVQLWPEHFDLSTELGSEAAGRRAGYGASPGDELHPEPYLYVSPCADPPPGNLWRATGFAGAELSYGGLLDAEDQRGAALAFLRARLRALQG